jgi:hypothetical protein
MRAGKERDVEAGATHGHVVVMIDYIDNADGIGKNKRLRVADQVLSRGLFGSSREGGAVMILYQSGFGGDTKSA